MTVSDKEIEEQRAPDDSPLKRQKTAVQMRLPATKDATLRRKPRRCQCKRRAGDSFFFFFFQPLLRARCALIPQSRPVLSVSLTAAVQGHTMLQQRKIGAQRMGRNVGSHSTALLSAATGMCVWGRQLANAHQANKMWRVLCCSFASRLRWHCRE